MLLNGLGLFQNALGSFQEAPERESLIFHWFWKVWVGGATDVHGARSSVRPPKTSFSRQAKHHRHRHRPKPRHKHRYRPRPRHRYRHRSLGYGAWCLTPTHTVAQSAVADKNVCVPKNRVPP